MNKTGKNKICPTCGKEFYVSGWQIKKGYGKFCSLNCRRKTAEEKKRMSLLRLGKPTWNKGKTKKTDKRLDYIRPTQFKSQGKCKLQEIVRHCYAYRQWRSDVFNRDKFTCVKCGQTGGRLEGDHIKPFSLIINENNIKTLEEALSCKELWNLDNGRTLCKECHKKTDTYLLGARYKNDGTSYFGVASLLFAVPA